MINGKGVLSNPTCNSVTMMYIFTSAPRRRQNHMTIVIMHHHLHINSWVCNTLTRNYFYYHFQICITCFVNSVTNPNSIQHNVTAIVLNIPYHKPVNNKVDTCKLYPFLDFCLPRKVLMPLT